LGVVLLIILVLAVVSRRKQLFMSILIMEDREKRLEIRTSAKWRETEIRYDGDLAAKISRRELIAGKDIQLSDGSALNIKLPSPNMQPSRLQITRNGQPLGQEVSGYENQAAINGAANIIFIISLTNLFVGIGSIFVHIEALAPLKLGWPNVIYGIVFLVLGIFAQRKSALAMILFVVLFGLDSLPVVLLFLQSDNYYVLGIILMRIVFFGPVLFGLSEIYRQKKSWLAKVFKWLAFVLIVISLAGLVILLGWIVTQVLEIRDLLVGG
jgi:heme exporter protein D